MIVDNDLKIVQFRGQTGAFLEPAPGEASLNLLKMAREGLLYGLRTTIHDARKKEAEARKEGLRISSAEGISEVAISVVPLGSDSPEGRHFLVLFETSTVAPRPPAEAARTRGKKKSPREDERPATAATGTRRQPGISPVDHSGPRGGQRGIAIGQRGNPFINEELQSTNEELDTAKEELQSTNEELNTVNEELHGRNDELMRRQFRFDQPCGVGADCDRDGGRGPAHPALHADGRESAEFDPQRCGPADFGHQAEHQLRRSGTTDH